jgi:hypothetical protein
MATYATLSVDGTAVGTVPVAIRVGGSAARG